MWIFTTSGFISAVQDSSDRTIIVRARDQKSLVQISQVSHSTIITTPFADYPYRVVLTSKQFIDWVMNQATGINYPNFKSAVQTHRGSIFAKALNKVWSIMHDVEDGNARRRNENR